MIPQLAREREIFHSVREGYSGQNRTDRNTCSFCCFFRTSLFTFPDLWRLEAGGWKIHFNVRPKPAGLYINRRASGWVVPDRLITFQFCAVFHPRTKTVRIFFTAHKDATASQFILHCASAERAGEFFWCIAERCSLRQFIFRAHSLLIRPVKLS